jgi:hypothetical protein
MKSYVNISDIQWDTDNEEAGPEIIELTLEIDADVFEDLETLNDCISDWLTDTFGFCHNGFHFKVSYETEAESDYLRTASFMDASGLTIYANSVDEAKKLASGTYLVDATRKLRVNGLPVSGVSIAKK